LLILQFYGFQPAIPTDFADLHALQLMKL